MSKSINNSPQKESSSQKENKLVLHHKTNSDSKKALGSDLDLEEKTKTFLDNYDGNPY